MALTKKSSVHYICPQKKGVISRLYWADSFGVFQPTFRDSIDPMSCVIDLWHNHGTGRRKKRERLDACLSSSNINLHDMISVDEFYTCCHRSTPYDSVESALLSKPDGRQWTTILMLACTVISFLCTFVRLYLPSLRCVFILSVGCNTILLATTRSGPFLIPVLFTIKIA